MPELAFSFQSGDYLWVRRLQSRPPLDSPVLVSPSRRAASFADPIPEDKAFDEYAYLSHLMNEASFPTQTAMRARIRKRFAKSRSPRVAKESAVGRLLEYCFDTIAEPLGSRSRDWFEELLTLVRPSTLPTHALQRRPAGGYRVEPVDLVNSPVARFEAIAFTSALIRSMREIGFAAKEQELSAGTPQWHARLEEMTRLVRQQLVRYIDVGGGIFEETCDSVLINGLDALVGCGYLDSRYLDSEYQSLGSTWMARPDATLAATETLSRYRVASLAVRQRLEDPSGSTESFEATVAPVEAIQALGYLGIGALDEHDVARRLAKLVQSAGHSKEVADSGLQTAAVWVNYAVDPHELNALPKVSALALRAQVADFMDATSSLWSVASDGAKSSLIHALIRYQRHVGATGTAAEEDLWVRATGTEWAQLDAESLGLIASCTAEQDLSRWRQDDKRKEELATMRDKSRSATADIIATRWEYGGRINPLRRMDRQCLPGWLSLASKLPGTDPVRATFLRPGADEYAIDALVDALPNDVSGLVKLAGLLGIDPEMILRLAEDQPAQAIYKDAQGFGPVRDVLLGQGLDERIIASLAQPTTSSRQLTELAMLLDQPWAYRSVLGAFLKDEDLAKLATHSLMLATKYVPATTPDGLVASYEGTALPVLSALPSGLLRLWGQMRPLRPSDKRSGSLSDPQPELDLCTILAGPWEANVLERNLEAARVGALEEIQPLTIHRDDSRLRARLRTALRESLYSGRREVFADLARMIRHTWNTENFLRELAVGLPEGIAGFFFSASGNSANYLPAVNTRFEIQTYFPMVGAAHPRASAPVGTDPSSVDS